VTSLNLLCFQPELGLVSRKTQSSAAVRTCEAMFDMLKSGFSEVMIKSKEIEKTFDGIERQLPES
jgi:hypothetical protein